MSFSKCHKIFFTPPPSQLNVKAPAFGRILLNSDQAKPTQSAFRVLLFQKSGRKSHALSVRARATNN